MIDVFGKINFILQNFFNWIKNNKFKSVIYVLFFILIFGYLSLPGHSIKELKKNNPTTTALMQQRIDEKNGDLKIIQKWVPLSRISQHMINAIIVAEDGTFYEHGGVDWYEVQESFERNLEEGRAVRGASTITQQLVKNLYLSTSKNPLRKLKELIITLRMERILKKNRILEIYLNSIEWGDGIFGVEAAAQKYFRKSAASLDRNEAARLAAVVPSPRKHKPTENTRWLNFRTNIILNRMEARGW